MTTPTTTWQIASMNCYPQADGETDVVFQINWLCGGTDGTYNASCYGSVNCTYVAGTPFTPYADLTQEQVLNWVRGSVDRFLTEASVVQQIDDQMNPPVVTPKLPWAA